MKKILLNILIPFIVWFPTSKIFGQRILGDCTIQFEIKAQGDSIAANFLKDASQTFYVRGGMSLTELRFENYLQSTIYNKSGDRAYVLYEINDEKYISILSNEDFQKQYARYKDLKLKMLNETKQILGYKCQKAIVTLKDGTKINIYFTPLLKTTVSENPYEFEKIDGLVLEYESQINNKFKVTYTAKSIDFDPVPASKFFIPKQGYRLLSPNTLPGAQ